MGVYSAALRRVLRNCSRKTLYLNTKEDKSSINETNINTIFIKCKHILSSNITYFHAISGNEIKRKDYHVCTTYY